MNRGEGEKEKVEKNNFRFPARRRNR